MVTLLSFSRSMNRSGATSVAPPHSSLNTLINPNDLMSFSFASSETCSEAGVGDEVLGLPVTDKVNDNTSKTRREGNVLDVHANAGLLRSNVGES